MKTTLRYLTLNAQAAWHRQVEEQLKHLHSLTAISAAEVVLEHQLEAKPAFRVQVRLEVPGPGIHAKATRHTRQAALLIHGPALHAEARSEEHTSELQSHSDLVCRLLLEKKKKQNHKHRQSKTHALQQ